jgi:hypothetical protein
VAPREKALLHQFERWIGGGHRFWHPSCAVLAERGGREGAPGAPAPSPAWTWLPRGTNVMTRAMWNPVVLKRSLWSTSIPALIWGLEGVATRIRTRWGGEIVAGGLRILVSRATTVVASQAATPK